MSTYHAQIKWQRNEQNFMSNQYSRGHSWHFDGGVVVPASASPHIVPLPYSIAENVDPEEAFVASLSSCHMLFFLSIAAKKKYQIEDYVDDAKGIMETDSNGNMSITRVCLKPKINFSGDRQPSKEAIQKMHQLAHKQCFLANSVKSEVVVEC